MYHMILVIYDIIRIKKIFGQFENNIFLHLITILFDSIGIDIIGLYSFHVNFLS